MSGSGDCRWCSWQNAVYVQIRIHGPLDTGAGGPGGWWILDEPEVHFIVDIEVSVPDIAGWRRERMPTLPDDHRFTVVPDWVCEILSPSTVRSDRVVKLPVYAEYGVRHVWLVDPIARLIEAHENVGGTWQHLGSAEGDGTFHLSPFDAIGIASPWY